MSIAIRGATPADDGPVGDLLVEAYQSQYALKMPDVVLPEGRITDLRGQASRRAIATVLVGEDGNLHVSEIWDSREQFEAFGAQLMPILGDVGIEFSGPPEIFEVHNSMQR